MHLSGRTADAFSAVLMAFVALQTAGVVMMPVLVPFLQDRYPMSDAQVGLLTSAFALAVALVAIPMGLASSRWGGPTLFAAAGFFLVGSLLLVVADTYQWMLVARFVQGIGAGAGIPVGTALISRFVTPAWRHRAFGMFGAGTGVGTVLTLLVLPSAAKYGGYSGACFVAALVRASRWSSPWLRSARCGRAPRRRRPLNCAPSAARSATRRRAAQSCSSVS